MVTREDVLKALEQVIDPELGVDIVNLGLVYAVEVFPDTGTVLVEMTLTTPGCPLSGSLPAAVERVVQQLDGVKKVKVSLVWSPPWDPGRMTPAARERLGWM